MPDVHGRSGTDLRERVGSLEQVLSVDSFVQAEGPGRGTRRLRLINGGGIEVDVHPDRGFDLGQVRVDGVPVAWISPTGIGDPASYEPEGNGWLRTFGGGLLATCGLDTFGPPSEDAGEVLGQHGRIGTQRAVVVRAEATAEGVVVEGLARQAAAFGEDIVLRRRISSAAGSDTITIDDTITNESFREQPLMVLYHMNLGWPLLDEDTTVSVPAVRTTPRDADAEAGIADHRSFGAPVPGFREQVFIHELGTDDEVEVVVANARTGLTFALTVPGKLLPCVYEWKMQGQGHYVLGIEPANTPNVQGRAAARAAGQLPVLAPGESVNYSLSFRLRRARRDVA